MLLSTDELLFFSLDLQESRDFYTGMFGCRVISEEDWGFIFLELPDGARIGLMHPRNWAGWQEGDPLPAPVLCLKTDDLDAAIARLTSRGLRPGEPDAAKGGARGCRLSDPAGHTIYLFEDPAQAMR